MPEGYSVSSSVDVSVLTLSLSFPHFSWSVPVKSDYTEAPLRQRSVI
jgi:hypothetical protein